MSAIDDVQAVETAWTTGRVIEKSLPTPHTVELRMHLDDRLRAPARPALPDPAARARRLHRPALLLDRLGRRRPARGVPRRAAAERRGLGGSSPTWPRSATCSRCEAQSDGGSPGTCLERALCLVGGTGIMLQAVSMLRTARRLGRSDLLRVVAVGSRPRDAAVADELGRSGALLAYTRHDSADRPFQHPDRRRDAPRCSRAWSWPTSAARPASRRTPRPCWSTAVSSRRPSAWSGSGPRAEA